MYAPLLVLAAGVFAIGTDSFVIAGILPGISHDLGISTAAAAQLITAYALPYALLSPVTAALTAAWPRRRVLLTGLAAFVVANLATALLPSYPLVLAARVLAGAGAAMVTPAATATGAMLAPAHRRGRAIAIVMTGLSAATALGAPIGTVIAGAGGGWRVTMYFVAALGALAAVGVAVLLPAVPVPPAVGLRARLAPLRDTRIALTLSTLLLVFTGLYTVYSYIGEAFDRATGNSATTLAALQVVWGVAATIGTLSSGSLTDRFGSRPVINTAVAVAAVDFALLPWTSRTVAGSAVALAVWGVCGWGALAPHTHRLISALPDAAPLLTSLGSATVYVAVSAAPVVGAAGIAAFGAHGLGPLGAVLIAVGLAAAEATHRAIRARASTPAPGTAVTETAPDTAVTETAPGTADSRA